MKHMKEVKHMEGTVENPRKAFFVIFTSFMAFMFCAL